MLADENAANDPNSATAPSGDPAHTALENNAHQLELFSRPDFSTTVDQAIEEATTLYFMSNGVYNTNSYVGQTTIGGSPFAANIIALNSTFPGTTADVNNQFPTARTLFNIIDSATVRNSIAGFMNWICDSNSSSTSRPTSTPV